MLPNGFDFGSEVQETSYETHEVQEKINNWTFNKKISTVEIRHLSPFENNLC